MSDLAAPLASRPRATIIFIVHAIQILTAVILVTTLAFMYPMFRDLDGIMTAHIEHSANMYEAETHQRDAKDRQMSSGQRLTDLARRQRQNAITNELHPSSQAEKADNCALLFFGIGRKFRDIAYPSVVTHILQANPTCDVFVHTYNVTKAHGGGRMGEDGAGIIDAHELLLLAASEDKIEFESEEEFQRQHNIDYYRTLFPKPSRWDYPASMDNMIRQWNSIDKVWAKMEAFEKGRGKMYDRVGLFRPDVLYQHPISIGDKGEMAVIPSMMYKPTTWGGYNDRMFYGNREFAECWATGRFNAVNAYLKWQKSNPDYAMKSGLHSEDFMQWLLVSRCPTPLTVKPICFKRIRSSGAIKNADCAYLNMGTIAHDQHYLKQMI